MVSVLIFFIVAGLVYWFIHRDVSGQDIEAAKTAPEPEVAPHVHTLPKYHRK